MEKASVLLCSTAGEKSVDGVRGGSLRIPILLAPPWSLPCDPSWALPTGLAAPQGTSFPLGSPSHLARALR